MSTPEPADRRVEVDVASLAREARRAIESMRKASHMLRHPNTQNSRDVVSVIAALDVCCHRLTERLDDVDPWLDAADQTSTLRRAALDHRGQP